MPFEADECYVGMIAYFAVSTLRRHRRIFTTATSWDPKPRPFVCYAEAEGLTYWTYFTGTPHPWRRTISRAHLRVPPNLTLRRFNAGELIVGDGSNNFIGVPEAFAECSRQHDDLKGMWRPVLLEAGVQELQTIVHNSGGLLPKTRRPTQKSQTATTRDQTMRQAA